ncbi:uncharacterized protein BO88DRAFT_148928 [Aspergillus vadensis CBS 113365]|uniref:Uncharacterized protein n=1 Tax=Aspergillus vadensis (strain CBS 113365 / IMI 142717 / IBT 24658) TaxID=1448311 RepID=A0A319B4X1_ASPVC|nr:hypothetical protein BO88DRAFT_148928 [Aspergillus vadensis CBS 113365]PYH65320.1 hypothetical protein BO88DRAFT_148928 [Aspergillus vadensis CBS 113365]
MQIRIPPPHSRYYSGIAPRGLAAVSRIIYRLEPVIPAPSRATATSFLGRSVIQVPVGPPYVISRFALFGHRLRLFPGLSLLLLYFTSSFFLLGLSPGFLPIPSPFRWASSLLSLPPSDPLTFPALPPRNSQFRDGYRGLTSVSSPP